MSANQRPQLLRVGRVKHATLLAVTPEVAVAFSLCPDPELHETTGVLSFKEPPAHHGFFHPSHTGHPEYPLSEYPVLVCYLVIMLIRRYAYTALEHQASLLTDTSHGFVS